MKTEVYSWRLTPSRKANLERIARRRKLKIAHVLDMAVDTHAPRQARSVALPMHPYSSTTSIPLAHFRSGLDRNFPPDSSLPHGRGCRLGAHRVGHDHSRRHFESRVIPHEYFDEPLQSSPDGFRRRHPGASRRTRIHSSGFHRGSERFCYLSHRRPASFSDNTCRAPMIRL